MTQPNDFAIWIILGVIVAFAAFVGFVIAYSQTRDSASEDDKVLWWPDKWLRLFWILSPFILAVVCALYFGGRGKDTGPLWAFFFALVIIQSVVVGMFGFRFDLVSSICCGIFISVEMLMLGGLVLFAIFDYGKYFAWYLVIGILAICAGIVLAAMFGTNKRKRRC